MYRSKETHQQAPQNKGKESYRPGPMERRDKTTVAGCPNGNRTEPQTPKGYRGERVRDGLSPVFGARQTLGTSKEVVLYHGIP